MNRVVRSWSPPTLLVIVAASVAIGAVVLVATWPMLSWPYPRWVETSAQWHQRFGWAGPIAGTVACWYATRFNPRHRIWNQPDAPRWGWPVVARHLRRLGAWLLGAYIVALAPLTAVTAIRGGAGDPAPLVMVSGILAMVAAIALGYALGTLAASVIMVPVTALALCSLNVLTVAGADTFAPVVPVLYLEPQLGQQESTPLVVFRTALFLLVAAAAAAVAAKTVLRRNRGETSTVRARLSVLTLTALAPAVLIGIALAHQPALFTVAPNTGKICRAVHGITYCVHIADEPQLDALVAAVDPIIARYGSSPDGLRGVWDQALVLAEPPPPHAGIAVVPLTGKGTIDLAQSGIVESLTGAAQCPPAPDAEHDHATTAVQRDLAAFLTHTTAPGGVFATMTVPQVQDWIRRNHTTIAACAVKPGDLPQRPRVAPLPQQSPPAPSPPPSPSRRRAARPSPVAAITPSHQPDPTVHSASSHRVTPVFADDAQLSGLSS